MKQSLYRKESFESKINGFSNPVTIRGSLSALYMSLGLLVIVLVLVIYAWVTPYTRKVAALGYIAPKSGNVTLSSPISGILKVGVKTGQRVAEGDVLATVSEATDSDSDDSAVLMRIDSIESRIELSDQRYQLLNDRKATSRRIYDMQIESAENLLESRRKVLGMQRKQLQLAQNSRDRINKLYKKKVATLSDLEEADSKLILATQSVIDAELQLAEALESSTNSKVERDLDTNTLEDGLAKLRGERLLLDAELNKLTVERVRSMRAPTSGILTYSLARNYQRVNPGEPLFMIEPIGDDYDAIVLAPSSAIGFAAVGDSVALHYAAYPYQDHGVFKGRIKAIDNVAQLPSAISAPIPVNEPVYRIYADVDQTPKNKRGEELRLISGMLFEAKIIAEEKSLLYWMLSPIF